MPFRKFRQTLNNLAVIIENPCTPSWSLLVDTAIPAAGDALLFLMTPSPLEILRRWLQPKSLRGPRGLRPRKAVARTTTRTGALLREFEWGLPEVAHYIAAVIPGRKYLAARVPAIAERLFWIGLARVEQVIWYWLVLDTFEEFFYSWSSGIIESRFCNAQFLLRYDADINTSSLPNQNQINMGSYLPLVDLDMRNDGQDVVMIDASKYFTGICLVSVEVRNTSSTLNGTCGLDINGEESVNDTLAPGETKTLALQWDFRHIRKLRVSGGGFENYDAVVRSHILVLADPDVE
jgi:hypothetical protein